jgi:hypothetical protein
LGHTGALIDASPLPLVSAIVVNFNRRDMLGECLGSLLDALGQVPGQTEAILVDNGSADGSVEFVRNELPSVDVVALPENRGFAEGLNEGLDRARGEWILVVNNDATIHSGAVREMLAAVDGESAVGSVAAQMRFAGPYPLINSAGIAVDRLGIAYDLRLGERPEPGGEIEEVFGASHGAALLRREMLEDIGGVDGAFFFSLDDADVAWRARMKGWRCLHVPTAVVHHHHGGTLAYGTQHKYFHVGLNRVRLLAKNASNRQLVLYGPAMLLYDLAYVAFVAMKDRTLAPAVGRVRGLREWRKYRRLGAASRRPVELAPIQGLRAALRRRGAYRRSTLPERL